MKTVDLFAGCGGLSLGFQNASFKITAAFDNWQRVIEIYRRNFHHPIYNFDLASAASADTISELMPEMIIGGPPCQDFSSAGKRDESLGRADLTLSFANIISKCRPEWFVMENVERITKSKVFDDAVQIFKNSGYGISCEVLNAAYCGVPQTRKRFFIVGHLHSADNFLNPYYLKNQSREPMTVFNYLGDSLGIENYYRHPRSYMRRGVFSIFEPSPTIRGVNRPIPQTYNEHPGDTAKISDNVRPLTTKERSYLQTFPPDFIFDGSKTELEQAIGNAVPVKLAEFVGKCIKEYICDERKQSIILDTQLEFAF